MANGWKEELLGAGTFRVVLVPLLAAILLLRLPGLAGRGLEFDEIWTLLRFGHADIATILRSLEVPNNHTLHSLLVRGSVALFGEGAAVVRLPALAAGLAAVAAFALLARRLAGGGRAALLLGLALFGLDGWQAHYGRTARGYSLQVLLFVIYGWALATTAAGPGRRPLFRLLLLWLAPILAFILLPSSALFILPAGLIHLAWSLARARWRWRAWAGKWWPVLAAHLAGALCCAFWLLLNREMLLAGRERFAILVTGLPSFLALSGRTLLEVWPWYLWLALLPLLAVPGRARRGAWPVLAGILLCLLLSAAVGFGPPRVYLVLQVPLYAVLCMGLVEGGERLARRRDSARPAAALLLLLLLLLGAAAPFRLRARTPLDWHRAYAAIEAAIPPGECIAYPVAGGYEIAYGRRREVHARQEERLPAGGGPIWLCRGEVSGCLPGSEKVITFRPAGEFRRDIRSIEGVAFHRFRLLPALEPRRGMQYGRTWFLSIRPGAPTGPAPLVELLQARFPGEWITVNPYLVDRGAGERGVLLAAREPSLPPGLAAEIEAAEEGRARFLRVARERGGR